MIVQCNVKSLESRSELLEEFVKKPEPKLLIESSDSSVNQYKLFQIDSFTLGLIDYAFGVPIQIDSLYENFIFLVGHESQIDCFSASQGRMIWTAKGDSVFFEFRKISNLRSIIVIEEAGVFALNYSGQRIWSRSTDVITRFEISESVVVIVTEEDGIRRISTKTGDILI